jgi:hypothetical protein
MELELKGSGIAEIANAGISLASFLTTGELQLPPGHAKPYLQRFKERGLTELVFFLDAELDEVSYPTVRHSNYSERALFVPS